MNTKAQQSLQLIKHKLDPNFKFNNFQNQLVKEFSEHVDFVYEVVKLDELHIASCSSDRSIRVWKLNRKTSIQTLKHLDQIWTMIKFNQWRLITGSGYANIILWNWKLGVMLKKFEGHNNLIKTIIKLDDYQFITCSFDKTIRIWNLINGKTVTSWIAHRKGINSIIKVDNENIISCSYDKKIKVWNMLQPKLLKSIMSEHYPCKTYLINGKNQVAVGTTSGRILIFQYPQMQLLTILGNHTQFIFGFEQLAINLMISYSQDQQIIVWDLQNFQQINKINSNDNKLAVQQVLKFNNKYLITAGYSCKIKIWC